MASRKKVALLFGGRSAEHDISLISASAVFKNLNPDKYQITCIYINREGNWRTVESPLTLRSSFDKGQFFSFLPWQTSSSSQKIDADIFFPVLHGPYGEDGSIQGLFELAGVPYVGATVLASALGMDKAVSKTLFLSEGLPVVHHKIYLESDFTKKPDSILESIQENFVCPFFIKPANLGSSIGITKVKKSNQILEALNLAFQNDRKIIVEEGIQGREIECSILGNDNPEASLPGEVIPHREFYDYRDKYIEGKTSFAIPANLPPSVTKEIQNAAIRAFIAIECSGMARVDFFIQEKTEKIFLSEINTIPGFTEISMYPKLWEISGLPFPALLDRLIMLGIERHRTIHQKSGRFRS